MFLSTTRTKFMGSVTTNTALILFIASLGILTAFVAMMYFDKKDQPSNIVDTHAPEVTEPGNIAAINDLTSQLMTERQLTNELNTQNEALKQQLQSTSLDMSKSDNNYLSALNNVSNSTQTKSKNNKNLEVPDYYNKVSLNSDNGNLLQAQINQFIDNESQKENIYFETLKVESNIRNNEVRSIVLKKGESIWMLAKRAYGSGFKYHKIMKANPQITEKNAKYLKVGTTIRVPL